MTFSSRTSAVAVISGLIEKALQFSEQVLHIWTEITLSNLHVFLVHIYTLNLHLNNLWCDCSVNVVHLNKCECCYMNLGAHLRNGWDSLKKWVSVHFQSNSGVARLKYEHNLDYRQFIFLSS